MLAYVSSGLILCKIIFIAFSTEIIICALQSIISVVDESFPKGDTSPPKLPRINGKRSITKPLKMAIMKGLREMEIDEHKRLSHSRYYFFTFLDLHLIDLN